jgi:ribonuclease P protein component
VYDRGARYSGPLFAAFCARCPEGAGPKIGFTVPRSLGGAVVRNRIKRRVREAVRLGLDHLSSEWEIVFNPRRAAMDSPFADLEREIQKLFQRCKNS